MTDGIAFDWSMWSHLFSILAFVFGACIGSFLNVCIYRIPRDQSVVRPRSHCPHCNRMIPWHLNIPLFSYVMLRGRCAFCKARITPRYVLVELLVAILFWIVWQQYGFMGERPILGLVPIKTFSMVPVEWLIVSGLVLGTFVDFEHLIIPDRVTLGGIAAGLFLSAAFPVLHANASHPDPTLLYGLLQSGIGLAAGWGTLWLVSVAGRMMFKQDAMGFGDVKLLGAIGAFLGWQAVAFNLVVSSFLGSLVGIALVVCRRKQMQSKIPYGPYIALAALLWMFWGPTWWQFYINLMTPAAPAGLTP